MPVSEHTSDTPTILLVEDDIISARVLTAVLSKSGYNVIHADSVAKAEAMVHIHPISLILLDVHLPDGNGLEFCAMLSEQPEFSSLPVLFVSSDDDQTVKLKGFGVGAVDYITKPFAGAEVLARVRTHLRLRQAYASLEKLQASQLEQLRGSKMALMPSPAQLSEANFEVFIHHTSDLDGNFYDVRQSGAGIYDYLVVDVTSLGVEVAFWTAAIKALFAEYASIVHKPVEICRMMNKAMNRILPDDVTFTLIYARLNRSRRHLQVVNLSYFPVMVMHGEHSSLECGKVRGQVMGGKTASKFQECDYEVNTGDRFYMFNFGELVLENDSEYIVGGLSELLVQGNNLPLSDTLGLVRNQFVGYGAPVADEILMLGVQV
jgi:phosphoserine phosphatase RsbU/P